MQNRCLKSGTAWCWWKNVLVCSYFLVIGHMRELNLLRAFVLNCLKFMVCNAAFCESARAPTRTPIMHFLCIVYSYIFACIVLRNLKLPGATTFPNYNVMWLFVNCCSLLPLYFVCCCFVAFLIWRPFFRTPCSHIVLQRIMLCVAPHCNGAIRVIKRHIAAKCVASADSSVQNEIINSFTYDWHVRYNEPFEWTLPFASFFVSIFLEPL